MRAAPQSATEGLFSFLDKEHYRMTGIRPKSAHIARKRKRPIRKGDTCYLYGVVNGKRRRIGATPCSKVEEIEIRETSTGFTILVDGIDQWAESDKLVRESGFNSIWNLIKWVRIMYGLPFKGEVIHFSAGTYDSKYYYNRKIKARGFGLKLDKTHKTIYVNQLNVDEARSDKYVKELAGKYQYGVQVVNPILYLIDN